jgi:hypothetical protein
LKEGLSDLKSMAGCQSMAWNKANQHPRAAFKVSKPESLKRRRVHVFNHVEAGHFFKN